MVTSDGFGGLLEHEGIVKRSRGDGGVSLWTSYPKMLDKKRTMVD